MSPEDSDKVPAAPSRGVVIASSHPLFRDGLLRLLQRREAQPLTVLGNAATTQQALAMLAEFNPAMIIVDYDDREIDRKVMLDYFVEGQGGDTRLVLVSLNNEGEVIVYDRRTLAPAQVEDWLGGDSREALDGAPFRA